jgi:urea transport system substrate-binding protein
VRNFEPVVRRVLRARLRDAGAVCDCRSDEPTFAREAERLITQEGVAALFGCWTSASRKEVLPILARHEHLLVYPL